MSKSLNELMSVVEEQLPAMFAVLLDAACELVRKGYLVECHRNHDQFGPLLVVTGDELAEVRVAAAYDAGIMGVYGSCDAEKGGDFIVNDEIGSQYNRVPATGLMPAILRMVGEPGGEHGSLVSENRVMG